MKESMVDALGWALIHSLWQCAAIALFFAAVNLALRRASANLRYLLGYASLLAMPAAMAATFLALLQPHHSVAPFSASLPILTRIAPIDLSSAISTAPSHPLSYLAPSYLTMI